MEILLFVIRVVPMHVQYRDEKASIRRVYGWLRGVRDHTHSAYRRLFLWW